MIINNISIKRIPKVLFIETLMVAIVFALWFLYSLDRDFYSYELLVDIIFVISLISMVAQRDSHPRYFWIGFTLLVLSSLASLFSISGLLFFLSSLSFGYFSLGILNLFLFRHK